MNSPTSISPALRVPCAPCWPDGRPKIHLDIDIGDSFPFESGRTDWAVCINGKNHRPNVVAFNEAERWIEVIDDEQGKLMRHPDGRIMRRRIENLDVRGVYCREPVPNELLLSWTKNLVFPPVPPTLDLAGNPLIP